MEDEIVMKKYFSLCNFRNLVNQWDMKKLAVDLCRELTGSIFIAAGIYNFAVQASFPITGFSGIAFILHRLSGVSIGLSTILLNLPVAFVCYRLPGKSFFISSARCMVLSSIMIDYVAPLFPVYQGSRLLAALCTGVCGGIGYALIYTRNSSTGGSDFIIMAVKAVKPHLSLGNIYGMIVNYIFAIMVDKVMYGINARKVVLIVTECGKTICQAIDCCCQRGSTILHANG